jgi:hypothetical protein
MRTKLGRASIVDVDQHEDTAVSLNAFGGSRDRFLDSAGPCNIPFTLYLRFRRYQVLDASLSSYPTQQNRDCFSIAFTLYD